MENQNEQSGRKLTKAEIERTERFKKIAEEFEAKGYKRVDLTVTAAKANVFGTLTGIGVATPFGLAFMLTGNLDYHSTSPLVFFLCVLAFVVSIVVHELLHGTGWALFAKNKFKSIAFGVVWQQLMPYCTCKEPLKKGPYIVGLVLPLIILGIIPSIVACILGSYLLILYGMLMIICAGGDLLILFLILKTKLKGDVLFLDHPTDVGLISFVKED